MNEAQQLLLHLGFPRQVLFQHLVNRAYRMNKATKQRGPKQHRKWTHR